MTREKQRSLKIGKISKTMAALKRHEKESVSQRKPLRAALLGFRLCEVENSKDVHMHVE